MIGVEPRWRPNCEARWRRSVIVLRNGLLELTADRMFVASAVDTFRARLLTR